MELKDRLEKCLEQAVAVEVERAGAARRLRHDLANQIGVVRELVRNGKAAAADRYLSELQEQVRAVGGGSHE